MVQKKIIVYLCILIMTGCHSNFDILDKPEETYNAQSDSPSTKLSNNSHDVNETLKDLLIDDIVKMASHYEEKELSLNDFTVKYKDMLITRSSTLEDFENIFGYPEGYFDSNFGNISNGNGYRRWQLRYPDYDNYDISIMFLSKQEINEIEEEYHGDTYLIGVYLNNIETYSGLRVGDPISNVFELYGNPTLIQRYDSNTDYIEFIYTKDENKLIVVLDETNSKVMYIFIDYRMEQSIRDQKIS